MNRNSISYILLSLLLILMAGCSAAGSGQKSGTDSSELAGITRDPQSSYSSSFLIKFNGSQPWSYQLTTRTSPTMREESLHIEGVGKAQNPGDIRMVTDGTNTWMTGEGTDQECVQFPNNQGMDPTFILPETLAALPEVTQLMGLVGEETIIGKPSLHYRASGVTTGGWKDATIDIWQAKENNTMLGFTIKATGEDPFFGSGSGTLMARYAVDNFDAGVIEPVTGCEISVPLPGSAEVFVRLPGMASFETNEGIEAVSRFYQTALPQENWTENEPLSQSEGSTILSYRRDAEQVEIHIEADADGGCKVKLLSLTGQ